MVERLRSQVHGALVELLGLGILLTGKSGIGKSECVLELVQRGFRLVADDVVCLSLDDTGDEGTQLVGSSPETIRHYLEIRGVGLVYIPDLYGPDSVLDETRIDLVCRLEKWNEKASYERIGIDRPDEELLGVKVPSLVLPVRPATSTGTLVEVAGRDALRRKQGVNAARRLDERLRADSSRA